MTSGATRQTSLRWSPPRWLSLHRSASPASSGAPYRARIAGHEVGERAEVDRLRERLGDRPRPAVEQRAREVEPGLDVGRVGRPPQGHAHLVGDAGQGVPEDLEAQGVGRAPVAVTWRSPPGRGHWRNARPARAPVRRPSSSAKTPLVMTWRIPSASRFGLLEGGRRRGRPPGRTRRDRPRAPTRTIPRSASPIRRGRQARQAMDGRLEAGARRARGRCVSRYQAAQVKAPWKTWWPIGPSGLKVVASELGEQRGCAAAVAIWSTVYDQPMHIGPSTRSACAASTS